MWVLTDVADWFDKERASNARFLENAANNTDDDFLGALAWLGIGLARVLNTGAGGFAGGFVDVLRIGDGVKEGGWGFGKDALRALALIGPAVRVGRYALGLVAAVDATPTVGNCAWVAASRAARMTGAQHFATVGSLTKAFGLTVQETGELGLPGVRQIIQALGGEAKLLPSVSSLREGEAIARSNPDGLVIFPVRFMRAAVQGRPGGPFLQTLIDNGHALIAKSVGGGVFIVDRSGKVYRSLDELAKVYGAEQGLSMTIHAQAGILVVKNSRVIGGINFVSQASSILNLITYEMRAVPNPLYKGGPNIYVKTGIENIYGWWWFNMDGGIWCYHFARNKTARWFDIYNHKNGQGNWEEKGGFVEVLWNSTRTRERWPLDIVPSNQKGTSITAASKPSEFTAVRVWDADITKIVGRWRMDCDRWIWNIDFSEDGNVKWSDYYNASMNGYGVWHLTKGGVYLMWASGSRDDWTFSAGGDTASGNATVVGKRYPFEAK